MWTGPRGRQGRLTSRRIFSAPEDMPARKRSWPPRKAAPPGIVLEMQIIDLQPVQRCLPLASRKRPCHSDADNHRNASRQPFAYIGNHRLPRRLMVVLVEPQTGHRQVVVALSIGDQRANPLEAIDSQRGRPSWRDTTERHHAPALLDRQRVSHALELGTEHIA